MKNYKKGKKSREDNRVKKSKWNKQEKTMGGMSGIYTDLALEERERFQKNIEIDGVKIDRKYDRELELTTTVVDIVSQNGSKTMGKPKGRYITMESNFFKSTGMEIKEKISYQLAEHIFNLLGKDKAGSVLIIGLGNAKATPDALGPKVAEMIQIKNNIYCISPGVLAQTGMETYSIIKGVVSQINPDIIIAIDSLAARNVRRVTTTIQLADTGIIPGSGVGNHRLGLNKESLGKKVIALGVPMVVSSATIVNDTMEKLLQILATVKKTDELSGLFGTYSAQEKYQLFEELLSEETEQMFVTPKDVDEIVENLSRVIAHSLNYFCEKMINNQ